MRLLKVILVALFAVVAAAGCIPFQDSPEEKVEKALDENAGFSVFLDSEATVQQRSGVRAWLEAQPGVTEISFQDKAAAYEKAKEIWADDEEFVESINEDSLPESFKLKVKDAATAREIRDGAAGEELEALPGVQEVVYLCTTVAECQKIHSSPSPTN
ncbi:cell division protein FtsX [Actinoplanes sp. GCM10030250]|uniref:cell division protein FtsX n=1 Tax=Actinoplanes sp. GCM10030250 TaxID=3273376 RepID=UPI00361B0A50